MHGLGNDFVVIDAINQLVNLSREQICFIANRHFGIGCDQILLVEKPQSIEADFRYRIFNANGNEVEQCGNGARCFGRFVVEKGLSNKSVIPVETKSGLIELVLKTNKLVQVNMGVPNLNPASLPFQAERQDVSYELNVDGIVHHISAISVGNPHAVLRVENIDDAPVQILGAKIESHHRFPQHVNVGFMQIVNRGVIRLRVFERGVGETQACGTGACAAMVAGMTQGWLDNEIKVELPDGELTIHWDGENQPLFMTGPATFVFEGTLEL